MKSNPSTEFVLLGALMAGPRHGYEILQFIGDSLDTTWRVSTSQLYVLLRRLEEQGYLASSFTLQESRPSKRVFSITEKGRQEFLEWVRSPTRHVRDLRMEFLAKIFFVKHLGLAEGERLVEDQIRLLTELDETLSAEKETEENSYHSLVLKFKLATVEAWRLWLLEEARRFVKNIHAE